MQLNWASKVFFSVMDNEVDSCGCELGSKGRELGMAHELLDRAFPGWKGVLVGLQDSTSMLRAVMCHLGSLAHVTYLV